MGRFWNRSGLLPFHKQKLSDLAITFGYDGRIPHHVGVYFLLLFLY